MGQYRQDLIACSGIFTSIGAADVAVQRCGDMAFDRQFQPRRLSGPSLLAIRCLASSAGDQAIGVDLTVAYAPVWRHLSQMSECSERCERALLSLEPHVTANMRLRMELQINLASAIFITMGPPEQAKALLTEALETADALNDLNAQAGALSMLISIYFARGEFVRQFGPFAKPPGNGRYLR